MENSTQQARNVDGSLTLTKEALPDGPLLLVDDMVDSRWTLTVAAGCFVPTGAARVAVGTCPSGGLIMSETLSPNTKAILLLTAPLIVGRGKRDEPANLLAPGEYTKLAAYLRETGMQPADLLGSDADQLLSDCHPIVDQDRLKRLLGRGFLLSQAFERWQTRAIWVLSRADDAYPRKLKARLKKDSPSLLYGCGDREILHSGGLAVVGSRNVSDSLVEYTYGIGNLAARARRTVVSGAARGVDQAAMRAALESHCCPTKIRTGEDLKSSPVL